MNDEHDNERADRAMLERIQHEMRFHTPTGDQRSCRYCWQPVFFDPGTIGLHDGEEWNLVYLTQEHPRLCHARSDGSQLSSLPHEPVPLGAVSLPELIRIAAMAITPPGDSAAVRDTNITWDYAMVRLITEAAGLTEQDEDYVYAAIIDLASTLRGNEFRRGAFRAGLTEPPASWGSRHIGIGQIAHAVRKRDRGPGRVLNMGDAERRERTWVEAGRLGHAFAEPGETYCRVCGCKEGGIQHDERYPQTGDLVP